MKPMLDPKTPNATAVTVEKEEEAPPTESTWGARIPMDLGPKQRHLARINSVMPWLDISEKLGSYMRSQATTMKLVKMGNPGAAAGTLKRLAERVSIISTLQTKVDDLVEREVKVTLDLLEEEDTNGY